MVQINRGPRIELRQTSPDSGFKGRFSFSSAPGRAAITHSASAEWIASEFDKLQNQIGEDESIRLKKIVSEYSRLVFGLFSLGGLITYRPTTIVTPFAEAGRIINLDSILTISDRKANSSIGWARDWGKRPSKSSWIIFVRPLAQWVGMFDRVQNIKTYTNLLKALQLQASAVQVEYLAESPTDSGTLRYWISPELLTDAVISPIFREQTGLDELGVWLDSYTSSSD